MLFLQKNNEGIFIKVMSKIKEVLEFVKFGFQKGLLIKLPFKESSRLNLVFSSLGNHYLICKIYLLYIYLIFNKFAFIFLSILKHLIKEIVFFFSNIK